MWRDRKARVWNAVHQSCRESCSQFRGLGGHFIVTNFGDLSPISAVDLGIQQAQISNEVLLIVAG